MIRDLWHRVMCRLTGKSCTPDYPSSRDLQKEMTRLGAKAEAQAVEMRIIRHHITEPTGNYMADRLRGIVEEGG